MTAKQNGPRDAEPLKNEWNTEAVRKFKYGYGD
jgi:hypothetical protein